MAILAQLGISPRLAKRLAPLGKITPEQLMLHEIYASVQGESSYAGLPCVFVRTTACHLRCSYCDTPHAFFEGKVWDPEAAYDEVLRHELPLVEITGGEPLLQPAIRPLMTRLCDAGFEVLLETSGSLPISDVDSRVVRIVDFKTPSSGEVEANNYGIVEDLTGRDEVKLVLGSEADYAWAKELMQAHDLAQRCKVLMGTIYGQLDNASLAEWIVRDRLPVRMQVQLHKTLWPADARGV